MPGFMDASVAGKTDWSGTCKRACPDVAFGPGNSDVKRSMDSKKRACVGEDGGPSGGSSRGASGANSGDGIGVSI